MGVWLPYPPMPLLPHITNFNDTQEENKYLGGLEDSPKSQPPPPPSSLLLLMHCLWLVPCQNRSL